MPGMRETVYLPPNLLGLKMSDWTVAIAGEDCQKRPMEVKLCSSLHLAVIAAGEELANALALRSLSCACQYAQISGAVRDVRLSKRSLRWSCNHDYCYIR